MCTRTRDPAGRRRRAAPFLSLRPPYRAHALVRDSVALTRRTRFSSARPFPEKVLRARQFEGGGAADWRPSVPPFIFLVLTLSFSVSASLRWWLGVVGFLCSSLALSQFRRCCLEAALQPWQFLYYTTRNPDILQITLEASASFQSYKPYSINQGAAEY